MVGVSQAGEVRTDHVSQGPLHDARQASSPIEMFQRAPATLIPLPFHEYVASREVQSRVYGKI